MAMICQPVAAPKSPIKDLIACWADSSKQERNAFSYVPWKYRITLFFNDTMKAGFCLDLHHSIRQTKCSCMVELGKVLQPDELSVVVDYLVLYSKLAFEERRSLILEWKRYASAAKFSMEGAAHRTQQHLVYLLPGSSNHRICKNALANILCKGRKAWDSIGRNDSESHALAGRVSNHRLSDNDFEKLFDYFYVIMKQGSPRATLIVAELAGDGKTVNTTLKGGEELVELPACYSKRSLYRSFLLDNGWEVTFDNQSRQKTKTEQTVSTIDKAISWPSFCLFWQKNFPQLVVQRPAEDICDDCVIFANRHKYLKRDRLRNQEDSDFEEGVHDKESEAIQQVIAVETESDADPIPVELENVDENALRLDDKEMAEHEEIVIKAAKHVMMARKQRLLFIKKKEDAKRDAKANIKQDARVYTFVADFAQNMYVPNFSAEQPGATYYYSPLNVYPFGVVDCGTDPSEMTAHVYYEGMLCCCCCWCCRN
jgi:hypothetical protein